MKRRSTAAFLLLPLLPAALLAVETGEAVPRPRGWVGTVEDWARGLGIAFAVLDLLLIILAWWSISRTGMTTASKQLVFVAIVPLPLALVFFAYSYGLEASKSVEACGACHVMTPYVNDMRDPKSETLAALHFKNRYIQENHCYTCHTDYGMYGTIKAKWDGLGHTLRYTARAYTLPPKISHPYSNLHCLGCHRASAKFLNPEKHSKEDMPALLSGKTSCLDCHAPAHPRPAEKRASQ